MQQEKKTSLQKRIENRRNFSVEKRVEFTEAAIDSLAPEIHHLYDLLRDIHVVLYTYGRLEMHTHIDEAIKRALDGYRRRWNGDDGNEY